LTILIIKHTIKESGANMKKKILYIIIVAIIIGISAGLAIPKRIGNIEKEIKTLTQNVKVIDSNLDHNQALDVLEFSQKQGLNTPSTLVNFDTHSDVYLNFKVIKPTGAGIENWVNEYIAKNNNVNEIYWVMPKEEAMKLKLRFEFGENKINDLPYGTPLYGNSLQKLLLRFIPAPLTIKAFEQDFLINPKTGILNEYIPDFEMNKLIFDKKYEYRNVKIITCTEETLPDFKDKDVFVSIDADYISNSGYDTIENFTNNKNEKQINKALFSMIKTMNKKHIKPQIISMTLSPQYLPKEDHPQLTKFFDKMIEVSGQKDALQTYTRHDIKDGMGKGMKSKANTQ